MKAYYNLFFNFDQPFFYCGTENAYKYTSTCVFYVQVVMSLWRRTMYDLLLCSPNWNGHCFSKLLWVTVKNRSIRLPRYESACWLPCFSLQIQMLWFTIKVEPWRLNYETTHFWWKSRDTCPESLPHLCSPSSTSCSRPYWRMQFNWTKKRILK